VKFTVLALLSEWAASTIQESQNRKKTQKDNLEPTGELALNSDQISMQQ
jgi:uncharacterized protein with GYD domain